MSDNFPTQKCPACGNQQLMTEEQVEDWNDPTDPDGHGQREYEVTYCPDCGEVIEENRL